MSVVPPRKPLAPTRPGSPWGVCRTIAVTALLVGFGFLAWYQITKINEGALERLKSDPMYAYAPAGATAVPGREKGEVIRGNYLSGLGDERPQWAAYARRDLQLPAGTSQAVYIEALRSTIRQAEANGWQRDAYPEWPVSDDVKPFQGWTGHKVIDGTAATLQISAPQWQPHLTRENYDQNFREGFPPTVSLFFEQADAKGDAPYRAAAEKQAREALQRTTSGDFKLSASAQQLTQAMEPVAAAIRSSNGSRAAIKQIADATEQARQLTGAARLELMNADRELASTPESWSAVSFAQSQDLYLDELATMATSSKPGEVAEALAEAPAYAGAARAVRPRLRDGFPPASAYDTTRLKTAFRTVLRRDKPLSIRDQYLATANGVFADLAAKSEVGQSNLSPPKLTRPRPKTSRAARWYRQAAAQMRGARPPADISALNQQLARGLDDVAQALDASWRSAAHDSGKQSGTPSPIQAAPGKRMSRLDRIQQRMRARGYDIRRSIYN